MPLRLLLWHAADASPASQGREALKRGLVLGVPLLGKTDSPFCRRPAGALHGALTGRSPRTLGETPDCDWHPPDLGSTSEGRVSSEGFPCGQPRALAERLDDPEPMDLIANDLTLRAKSDHSPRNASPGDQAIGSQILELHVRELNG